VNSSPDFILPPALIAAARRVVEANAAIGRRVTLAESCTGGLVMAALTEIPGSSAVFDGGYVTYADDVKMATLGVSLDVLETFGAVSLAAAWGMADGALARSEADVAVAISGIAGPGGGTEKKPVGTVVFARAIKGQHSDDAFTERRDFGAIGRGAIRLQSALVALELLMPIGVASP